MDVISTLCMVFGLVFFTVKLAKPAYEYSSSNSIISLTLAKTCSIFFLPESCEPLTYQMGSYLFLQSPEIAIQDERQRNLPNFNENSPFLFLQMKPQNL